MKMEWTVRIASGSSRFITSDRPVIRDSADGKGLGRGLRDLRSEIKFPLSSTSILEMKYCNWLPDAVRKRHRNDNSRVKKRGDTKIKALDADDAFVQTVNTTMAKQAHLWVFSGREQVWLKDWMKEPLKPAKRAVTVLDHRAHAQQHTRRWLRADPQERVGCRS